MAGAGEIDPREAAAERRLSEVRRILAVASSKGGVGKSLLSAVLALLLSRRGYRTGLLDLDFHSPSLHLILGRRGEVREERGILPATVHGLRFLSVVHFSGERPLLLRKESISSSLLDLLSSTRWGELDHLVVDMPPGSGDELLELLRVAGRTEFLLVSTPSRLCRESVERMVRGLREVGARVVGVVENFSEGLPPSWEGVRVLGSLRPDPEVEGAVGRVERLLRTSFAREAERVLEEYLREGNGPGQG